ncbi:MAG: hypothetical protein ACRCSU_09435 [Paracoccaceae bacterium]
MSFIKHALFAFVLTLTPAIADEMPEDVRTALTAEVANFGMQFNDGNMAAIFDYMPAKVVKNLTAQSGLSQEELFAAMKTELDSAMSQVTIEDFSMDMETATWQMTPDGSIGYALIPTATNMSIEGMGKVNATGETLAFQEAEKWYLVRVDDAAQSQMLIAAYPAFEGVTFTPGKMDVVAE